MDTDTRLSTGTSGCDLGESRSQRESSSSLSSSMPSVMGADASPHQSSPAWTLTVGQPGNAYVQQQSTAVSPLLSAVQRGSPTLSAPQQHCARAMPSLCKQGVRGSSPLGSTICPCQRHFAAEEALKGHKYSSKVQQRWRRLVMLGGLPAAHRTPSVFASPVAGHLELTQVLAFVFV